MALLVIDQTHCGFLVCLIIMSISLNDQVSKTLTWPTIYLGPNLVREIYNTGFQIRSICIFCSSQMGLMTQMITIMWVLCHWALSQKPLSLSVTVHINVQVLELLNLILWAIACYFR